MSGLLFVDVNCVAERLQFLVKPRDASLAAGSDVTIACSASAGASLSWRRVGVAVLPDHVTWSEDGRLRMRGVRRSDAGLYVCTASSADHSQTIDATIRIDVTGDYVIIIIIIVIVVWFVLEWTLPFPRATSMQKAC